MTYFCKNRPHGVTSITFGLKIYNDIEKIQRQRSGFFTFPAGIFPHWEKFPAGIFFLKCYVNIFVQICKVLMKMGCRNECRPTTIVYDIPPWGFFNISFNDYKQAYVHTCNLFDPFEYVSSTL